MAHGRGARPVACKQCGVRRDDGHVISFRGLCGDCAAANVAANNYQLHAKRGPTFDAWLARMRESMQRLDSAG